MSAALQRLVARATGALTAGMRPRLASRFETGIREAGPQEIHAEVAAETAPTPRPSRAESPEAPALRIAAAAAKPPPAQLSPAAVTSLELAPERHVAAIPAMPERRATVSPEPLHGAAPKALLETRAAPELPRAPMVANAVTIEEVAAPVRAAIPPPTAPEPLLPLEPAPRIREAPFVAPPDRPAGRAAPQRRAEAQEPEISIQIGRIDIRAEAARPAGSSQRSAQPRPLPALSDYLRGGRS
jgi:hypothetical protein